MQHTPASKVDGRSGRAMLTQPDCAGIIFQSRRLHELDGGSVGVANIDDTFSGVRTRAECLRFASDAPAGGGDCIQDGVEVLDCEREMYRSNIARAEIDMFSVVGSEIFKQLDLVSVAFQNGD
jgi:hypothetical protein